MNMTASFNEVSATEPEIDQRIDHVIMDNPVVGLRINPIRFWKWHGIPGPYSQNSTIPRVVDIAVLETIKKAKVSDCLRSRSEYVREAKAWLIDRADTALLPLTPHGFPKTEYPPRKGE